MFHSLKELLDVVVVARKCLCVKKTIKTVQKTADNLTNESKVSVVLVSIEVEHRKPRTDIAHFHRKAHFLRIHVNFIRPNIVMHTEHSIRVYACTPFNCSDI